MPVIEKTSAGADIRARDLELDRRSTVYRILSRVGVLGVLIVLIAVFAIAKPDQFATAFNARTLVANSSTLIILAVGLTFALTCTSPLASTSRSGRCSSSHPWSARS